MTALMGRGPVAVGPDAPVLELLAPWRAAGVLSDGDVHVAATLCRLTGLAVDGAGDVVLAAALAARAPRLGHTCLDLTTVAASAPAEVEGDRGMGAEGQDTASIVEALPWPTDVAAWRTAVAASPLVAGERAPLVLEADRLYLERYHRYELDVAAELRRRAAQPAEPLGVDDDRRRGLLDALVPPPDGLDGEQSAQWRAATAGATRPLAVILGGPGTGKTHTVAALLALLLDGPGGDELGIALAAPTGKAAARMTEAFRARADELRSSGVAGAEVLADRLAAEKARTIHSLLGARPGSATFRRNAADPLTADVVIVDETSMVSLPLMAHLLDAVRPDARLVLVGDPGQLASVEAGSVLGDIAGPLADGAAGVQGAKGEPVPDIAACVSVLDRSFRFPPGSPIDRLARAIRAADPQSALAVLQAGGPVVVAPHEPGADRGEADELGGPTEAGADAGAAQLALDLPGTGRADGQLALGFDTPEQSAPSIPSTTTAATDETPPTTATSASDPASDGSAGVEVRWVPEPADGVAAREAVKEPVLDAARAVRRRATDGDVGGALDALGSLRVLCAHRRGPFGVTGWNGLVESWLTWDSPLSPGFYLGRPVLVTANDRTSGLFNGDLGVTVAHDHNVRVAFPAEDGPRLVAPVRLEAVETVHAMTIHKSQGSEFDHVVVVLPPPRSRLATAELLYTAVTRAARKVTLVGTEASVRAAITTHVRRASGLRARLWGEGPTA